MNSGLMPSMKGHLPPHFLLSVIFFAWGMLYMLVIKWRTLNGQARDDRHMSSKPTFILDMAGAYQHIKNQTLSSNPGKQNLEKTRLELAVYSRIAAIINATESPPPPSIPCALGQGWRLVKNAANATYLVQSTPTAASLLVQCQVTSLTNKQSHEPPPTNEDIFKAFHHQVQHVMTEYAKSASTTRTHTQLFLEYSFVVACVRHFPDVDITGIPGIKDWIAVVAEPSHVTGLNLYVCGLCGHSQNGHRGSCGACGGNTAIHSPLYIAPEMGLDIGGSVISYSNCADTEPRNAIELSKTGATVSFVPRTRARGRPRQPKGVKAAIPSPHTSFHRDDLIAPVLNQKGYKKQYNASVHKMWTVMCKNSADANSLLTTMGHAQLVKDILSYGKDCNQSINIFRVCSAYFESRTTNGCGVHSDEMLTVIVLANNLRDPYTHRDTLRDITKKVFRYYNQVCSAVKRIHNNTSAVLPFHPFYLLVRILSIIGYVCSVEELVLCADIAGEATMRLSETSFETICHKLKWPFIAWANLHTGTTQQLKIGGVGTAKAVKKTKATATVFIPTISRRVSPLEYVGLS